MGAETWLTAIFLLLFCFTFKKQFAILKINVRLAAAITTSNSKENKNEYKKTKYCFYII